MGHGLRSIDGSKILDGKYGEEDKFVGDFFIFEDSLRNGAFVGLGNISGDGKADLIGGGGPGGGPRVRVFDGASLLRGGPFNSGRIPV